MRTALKWIVRILGVLIATLGLLLLLVYYQTNQRMAKTYEVRVPSVTVPSDAATLERGKYLVERRAICIECHDKDLGGRIFVDDFAFGRLAATNLTRGRGGIGSRYTDEDFVRVLVHGVNKSGHSVIFMPSQDARFTEPDLAAIIAYIRSVPPVDREPAATRLGPIARALTFFHKIPLLPAEEIDHNAAAVLPTAAAADPVARGRYLVDSGGCRGCHTPELTGGGGPPPGAANITPVGIGTWTEGDFLRAVRQHKRPNGTDVAEGMPRAYGLMSDEELRLIFTYLKTVPPKGQKTKSQQQG
jgi:mono/diheme cytochrome c family protein